MTTPSARRSLHHCSPRSEKMQRAVDKLITLLTKVCRPVSRRLSVIEHGDPLWNSLTHKFQTSEKIRTAAQKMSKSFQPHKHLTLTILFSHSHLFPTRPFLFLSLLFIFTSISFLPSFLPQPTFLIPSFSLLPPDSSFLLPSFFLLYSFICPSSFLIFPSFSLSILLPSFFLNLSHSPAASALPSPFLMLP